MFRDRPLAWLFVAATILVDATLVCSRRTEIGGTAWDWIEAFLLGQSAILGAWLATGQLHRLARGAFFVAGLVGLAFIFHANLEDSFGFRVNLWGIATALFPSCAAITYATVLFLQAIMAKWMPNGQSEPRPLRFPLVELFGWTIVVALGSVAMRQADFLALFNESGVTTSYLVPAALGGFLVVIFFPTASLSVRAFFLATVIEASYLLLRELTEAQGVRSITCYAPHLYIAFWLIVQRLDLAPPPLNAAWINKLQSTDSKPSTSPSTNN